MTVKKDDILQLVRMGLKYTAIQERLKVSLGSISHAVNNATRIVIIADLHCGHRAGLTPPEWQWSETNPVLGKWATQQRMCWNWYEQTIKDLQPIDALIVNGDATDGKGTRSGGTELIVNDMNQQVQMAKQCIELAKSPKILITRGTPYHTGSSEDYEDTLAAELGNVQVKDHAFPVVNNIQFSIRHFQASSGVPQGRMTAKARSRLWNQVWHAENEAQPNVNVFIRSHTHYFYFCGGNNWLAISTPALCGWGSKFGQRICEGVVNFGLVWFDIPRDASCLDDVTWHKIIPELECHRVIADEW